MSYTLSTQLDAGFDDAVERVRSALSDEGFGVLTEIDMQATMAEKLDREMERYVVLGACNPQLAAQALDADRAVGALLPCNVVVREDGAKTVVDALDPGVMSQLGDGLDDVANDARARLQRVIAAL